MCLRIPGFLILVLFLSSQSFADKGPPVPNVAAREIADNVYVIHGPLGAPTPSNQGFMNNPGFAVTAEGIVVIDPGSSVQVGEMLLGAIRSVSDKPVVAVFNTHIHGDHWLGNQAVRSAYPNAPIYGHPNMIALIEAGEGRNWVELMERLTEGKTAGTRVVAPNKPVSHDDEFQFGDMIFRIHHYGKAHTTSDIMVEIPQASVTFLGDNVLNQRIPRIDDGNILGNVETCNRIMKTDSKLFVPGHGPTGDAHVPQAFRRYLYTLYQSVKRYYDEGLSDFEMKDQVATDLDEFSSWSGFDEQLGKHISIAYLQIEEAEF